MKLLLIALLFCTGCNSTNTDAGKTDELKKDQNGNSDTRTVDPSDTSQHLDTGSYDKMSDTLRKQ